MRKPRPLHYWRSARASRMELAAPPCDVASTIRMLSVQPQPALGCIACALAFLTTPFKLLGISGWKETGCTGRASGRAVRDAQHSTDGFWTVDVALASFVIGASATPPDRFIRVEVEPGTRAHDVCRQTRIRKSDLLAFSGFVVIDEDGPFLEVHPTDDFAVGAPTEQRPAAAEMARAR